MSFIFAECIIIRIFANQMNIYSMVTKKERHKIIVDLVLSNHISNQDILLNLLITKGCDVTQATLSRDMKELKIAKAPNIDGEYIYQLTGGNPNTEKENTTNLASYGFISIGFSGNLGVIKTRPGYAMAIAGEIDEKASDLILGTVAGDDTILLIAKETVSKQAVILSLAQFIPNIK